MEKFLTQARRFVESAIYALFVDRDLEAYLFHLDQNLCWIGVEETQHGMDRDSLETFIAQSIEEHPEPLCLSKILYNSVAVSDNLGCIMAVFRASADASWDVRYAVQMKTSWIVKRFETGDLKIMHAHFSIPYTAKQVECAAPLQANSDDYLRLQKMLHEKTAEINKFYNVLSGGVCKLVFDDQIRVIYASEYLLHMFGLTETDLVAAGYRTLGFVYESDIPMVCAALEEGLAAGEPFTIQYRVRHKNGNLVWVKVRGLFSGEFMNDSPIYYCIFTDVTELVRSYEQIAQERERYRIMNELTEGIAFEYDVKNDVMEFPNRFEKYFDFQPVVKNFKKHVVRELLHEDDTYRKIRLLCRQIADGELQVGEEVRLKTRGGLPLWFSISMAALRGEDGQSSKVIGKLVDIDRRKSAQIALEKKSQRDPMTDLYNKVSAEQMISEDLNNLAPGTMAAFLIFDIDNFKLINDTKGHFFGDHVIRSIADTMRTLFRDTDLLCRFGGDEFVVFMRGVYMESLVVEKAALLAKAIESGCLQGKDVFPLTVSIGIAIADGSRQLTYQQLFKRADKALYVAKNRGKNRFEVYNSTMEAAKYAPYAARMNVSSDVLYAQAQSYQAVVDTALDILLQTEQPREAIVEILRFLGATLKLSQSYTSAFAKGQIRVVAQWSVEGNELPDWIALDCADHLKNFDGDGVLLCSDTSRLPSPARDICADLRNGALLQCLFCKNNRVVGLAGFSNAEPNRVWTQNEIDMLKTVTKILTNSFVSIAGI